MRERKRKRALSFSLQWQLRLVLQTVTPCSQVERWERFWPACLSEVLPLTCQTVLSDNLKCHAPLRLQFRAAITWHHLAMLKSVMSKEVMNNY
jgi:hypothetical protein